MVDNAIKLSEEDVRRVADAVHNRFLAGSRGSRDLTDADLHRIASAVLSLIEERAFISSLADSVMAKTAKKIEEMKEVLEENPFHEPRPECEETPIELTEDEKVCIDKAQKLQGDSTQAGTLEPLKSNSSDLSGGKGDGQEDR
ncbi:hypothetical protein J7K50_02465 [bacterium]|nr:hypothetical protein [bacterium]